MEGVPGLPGAPQDEAGLTRKFETSHVGGLNVTFSALATLLDAPSAGQKCQSPGKVHLSFVNRKLSESTSSH